MDTWTRVNAGNHIRLEPWAERKLVGFDGSPLHVHGQAEVQVEVQGELLQAEVLVVSPLTTEAILGLDFLRKHKVTIDIREKRLTLSRSSVTLSLREKLPSLPKCVSIQVTETIKIPPYSEMEVTAYLVGPVAAGTWLMEGCGWEASSSSRCQGSGSTTDQQCGSQTAQPTNTASEGVSGE